MLSMRTLTQARRRHLHNTQSALAIVQLCRHLSSGCNSQPRGLAATLLGTVLRLLRRFKKASALSFIRVSTRESLANYK